MAMKFFNRKIRSQTGDTIVEVLISVCVISLVLAGCYAVANRSLQTGTESAQRSEALALAQQQIEYIKASPSAYANQSSAYCIVDGSIKTTSSDCQLGSNKQYTVKTTDSGLLFTIKASWPANNNEGQDQLTLYYRLPGSYKAPIIGDTPFATSITRDKVTLNGTINSEGNSTNYHFEYWTQSNPSAKTHTPIPSQSIVSTTDQPVLSRITGLSPGTTYIFQLCADDFGCSANMGSFTTIADPTIDKFSLSSSSIVSSSSIQSGDSVTLYWQVSNVKSQGCWGSGNWSDTSLSSISGTLYSKSFSLSTGNYTFILNCTGTDGVTIVSTNPTRNITVIVTPPPPPPPPPAPTVTVTVDDGYGFIYNSNTNTSTTPGYGSCHDGVHHYMVCKVSWSSSNATACNAYYTDNSHWLGSGTSGTWTGQLGYKSGATINIYAICSGPGGTGSANYYKVLP